MQQVLLKNIG